MKKTRLRFIDLSNRMDFVRCGWICRSWLVLLLVGSGMSSLATNNVFDTAIPTDEVLSPLDLATGEASQSAVIGFDDELRTDVSDDLGRDRVVGSHAIKNIQDIQFVQPREADQSAAFRLPRFSSVHSTVNWVSPRAVHRTLYFDDDHLERCGQSSCYRLQPAISLARFGIDTSLFPVRRLIDFHGGWRLHSTGTR